MSLHVTQGGRQCQKLQAQSDASRCSQGLGGRDAKLFCSEFSKLHVPWPKA